MVFSLQLRDSVVPGVRVFDPSDPPLPHLYRACVHTALCTVSRCCVWVDQFAEVFKFANAAELALPVKFGNVPYSMEEYLRRFMSPHTVRVFECDGRAAVTLAMPDAPPEEERRETDWLDDRDRRDERTARTTRRGGDGRENERPRDDDWNFDANRRREREFDTRRDDDDDMRPRKKMKVVVAHKNGPRTHHPPADPSQSCWYMDTHGNNGLIIGTKGATIKSMQKQSGAMIDANFMDHKVFITGRPDAVLKARRMIEHRLGEKGHKFLGAATLDDLNADLRYEQRQDRELWTEQRRSPELTPPPAVVEQEDSKDSVTEACTTPEDKNQSPLKEQQSPSRLKAKQRVSPNICTFFDAGNCRKGASCRFSHVIAAPKATPTHECKSCKLQFADLDALKRHKFSEAHLKAIRTAEGFDSPENKFNGDRVFCDVCKVYVQGLREQANFRQHVAGEKHKEKLALFGGIPAPKKFDHLKCKLCNHLSGSLADIQAHYKGAMHKERLALFGGDNVCQPIVPMESPAASPEPTVCASPDAPSPPPGGIRSNQLANRCDECKETFGSSEELRVHKTTTTHKTRIDEINKNFDEMRKKYMEVERPRAEAERVAKKKADKAKDSAWRDIQRQHAANWRGK